MRRPRFVVQTSQVTNDPICFQPVSFPNWTGHLELANCLGFMANLGRKMRCRKVINTC